MAKLEKITAWDQLKKQKKTADIEIRLVDGTEVLIEVKGLSRSEINNIYEKYDSEKRKLPKPQEFDKVLKKYIDSTEGPKYEQHQASMKALDALQSAELALAFLVAKPEGSFEEQVRQLDEDITAGQFSKIIEAGLQVSGFGNDNDQLNDAKKS